MTTSPPDRILSHKQIKQAFDEGKNITALMKQHRGLVANTEEAIEIAYDLQSGRYVQAMAHDRHATQRTAYATAIAREIKQFADVQTLLEAGIGEATTFSGVVTALGLAGENAYGFDLSWSRLAFAKRWLSSNALVGATLCTGSLLAIPFADNSIDVVYTAHAIEPNGGCEEAILRELYRVARLGLVLVEPCYELASPTARQRMERLGYCRNLKPLCEQLGYNITKHALLSSSLNPNNPSAVLVIAKKPPDTPPPAYHLACPRYRTPLQELGGMLYSEEALSVYPVIGGIPCLRPESAILASHYPDFSAPQEPA